MIYQKNRVNFPNGSHGYLVECRLRRRLQIYQSFISQNIYLNCFFLPGMLIQLFHLLFAGIGAFLLLRHFKCSDWAAGLGAIAFMITPYMVTMVVFGHGSQMMTAAYIPWVFWLTVRLYQNTNFSDTGWLAVLLGFQLQRGHAQIAYYTWMLIGAYSLLMLITGLRNSDEKTNIGKGFGYFILDDWIEQLGHN